MRPSLPTLDEEGRENVEMATLHSEVSTTRERASEPSITATLPSQRGVEHSYSEPAKQLTRLKSSMSSKSAMRSVQHKQTGRAADWHSDPKPDLWKVALISARMVARKVDRLQRLALTVMLVLLWYNLLCSLKCVYTVLWFAVLWIVMVCLVQTGMSRVPVST